MRKFLLIFMAVAMTALTTACGSTKDTDGQKLKSTYKVAMASDVGGTKDQSFNQSAWEGLEELEKETGAKVSYIESNQASDYNTNLDRLTDSDNDFIWGIGYSFSHSILEVANKNPSVSYGIADFSLENTPPNVTSVDFFSEHPSFLVGYVAAKTTKTNKIGFIGGIDSAVISQFKYGYQAGAKFAAKELGKNIEIISQYAETFTDSATGKAITSKMYSDGCDIVFHAAGKVGDGVISAAVEYGKFAIGVDRDQSDKAPDNVLISAMKYVGKAVKLISTEFINGEEVGGKVYKFGLKEECVGIPPKDKCPHVEESVYDEANKIREKIISGEINVPSDLNSYNQFIEKL